MASSTASAFEFPREYFFPPFFTRQTNPNTRHAQLAKWSSLVLSYCQHHRIFKLSLSLSPSPSSSSSAAAVDTNELFHNRRIKRQLAPADIRELVEFMRRDGRVEYVAAGDAAAAAAGDLVWVYWRTPEEWASLVEAWVEGTAQKGAVLTLYELTDGEATRGAGWLTINAQEFHGIDRQLLQKALNVLVRRGKAQVFGHEDSQGVKFF